MRKERTASSPGSLPMRAETEDRGPQTSPPMRAGGYDGACLSDGEGEGRPPRLPHRRTASRPQALQMRRQEEGAVWELGNPRVTEEDEEPGRQETRGPRVTRA
nr:unnamed protein product [Digitaria exilis]